VNFWEHLAGEACDLEYTHVRVCRCGRRVASGIECTHGEQVCWAHPDTYREFLKVFGLFEMARNVKNP
jgi:hypothetical protein